MNCNDCGGFLPGGCECSPFGGRLDRYRVIEEADADIAARQPEPEPHYLRPTQASLLDPTPGVLATPKPYQCDACDWRGGEHELVQQCVPCCPKCLGDVSEAPDAGVALPRADQSKGGA